MRSPHYYQVQLAILYVVMPMLCFSRLTGVPEGSVGGKSYSTESIEADDITEISLSSSQRTVKRCKVMKPLLPVSMSSIDSCRVSA